MVSALTAIVAPVNWRKYKGISEIYAALEYDGQRNC